MAAVTERANLHRTGVRRYYASKEELLLELAERGWAQWRDAVKKATAARDELSPVDVAKVLAGTVTSLSVFCDLLTHVVMSLENDVGLDRARRYKSRATAAHESASSMTLGQIQALVATTVTVAAGLWQAAHPAPTLAALYEQEPQWAHAALDFEPRVSLILQATAVGLGAVLPEHE